MVLKISLQRHSRGGGNRRSHPYRSCDSRLRGNDGFRLLEMVFNILRKSYIFNFQPEELYLLWYAANSPVELVAIANQFYVFQNEFYDSDGFFHDEFNENPQPVLFHGVEYSPNTVAYMFRTYAR